MRARASLKFFAVLNPNLYGRAMRRERSKWGQSQRILCDLRAPESHAAQSLYCHCIHTRIVMITLVTKRGGSMIMIDDRDYLQC